MRLCKGMLTAQVFDNDALTVFAAMTVKPTMARMINYNDFILGLKTDGIWSKLDWISLLAAHDAQAARVNLKKPSQVATANGTTTFTTDRGYKGNGSTGYLDSGRSYTDASNVFSQNSGHVMSVVTGGVPTTEEATIGQLSGLAVLCGVAPSGSNENYRINSTTAATVAGTGIVMSRIVSRTSSTATAFYRQGLSVASNSNASAAVLATNFVALRTDTFFGTNAVIGAIGFGSGLTSGEAASYNARLRTYMAAVGVTIA